MLLLILLQFPSLSFSTCFLKSVTIPGRDGIAERPSFKKIEIVNLQNMASFNRKKCKSPWNSPYCILEALLSFCVWHLYTIG